MKIRVFENTVNRRTVGPKMEEVTGQRRNMHKGEFHSLHSSPNVVKVIKSRRTGLTGHVTLMEGNEKHLRILV
jgi:hypothetical protein